MSLKIALNLRCYQGSKTELMVEFLTLHCVTNIF